MTSQINGLNVAVRNANDGISMAQTAEGAMQESTNILQRMRDLSVQAANGSNSDGDRASLQEEVVQLQAELTRISDTTEFGGQKLLDGTAGTAGQIAFQVGANANETISFTLDDMDASALGSLGAPTFDITDLGAKAASSGALASFTQLEQDGSNVGTPAANANDLATALNSTSDLNGVTAKTAFKLDFGGATHAALDIGGNTYGTAGAGIQLVSGGDAGAAFASGLQAALGSGATVTATSGSVFTVELDSTHALGGTNVAVGAASANQADITNGTHAQVSITTMEDNAAGTLVDVTGTVATTADANLDVTNVGGHLDMSAATFTDSGSAITAGGGAIATASTTITNSINDINIGTAADAQSAIQVIDDAIGQIDEKRAELGAVQNRFESTISNLTNISENVSAARSRIRDVDFAQETAKMSQNQILQQAGTTILAQANQLPQAALSLLG
jgi:flagellin